MRGEVIVVGLGGAALPYAASLTMTLAGSTAELAKVVALVEAGRIKPHIEKFPLSEVDAVYDKLANHEISGRAVLTP